jgi:hypothetical protein
LERILDQHDYPPEVEALVAEAALLTALIGQTIKLRWKLSLQVRGDGPIRLIATDFYAPRGRRARPHPRLCQLRRRAAGTRGDPFRQIGKGYFAILIDQGGAPRPTRGSRRWRAGRCRLRRDLFRPVRTAADAVRAELWPEPNPGEAGHGARAA